MISYITLALAALAAVFALAALLTVLRRKPAMKADIKQLYTSEEEARRALRAELAGGMGSLRTELGTTIVQTAQSGAQMQADTQKLVAQQQSERILQLQQSLADNLLSMRQAMQNTAVENEQKLENIRLTMEKNLTALREENARKLDEMRHTVDEKLQKTLDDKLQQSFGLVSERLEQVYKGLGEMQTLAAGVGDLKKVLSNVKTRGIWGEIQLGAILEQMLSPEQYAVNIATVKGSSERVEYAIKLPGSGEESVYLPIDAKFPIEDYQAMVTAYDAADTAALEIAARQLEAKIKRFAKDIHDKYIHVPETTDFGIMFLPIEGLYAEVVRRGLVECLQADYKIVVAGPTTLSALLNSLQMGFKTLAIQQRSSEVWNILSEVKSEFATFGKSLEMARSRIRQADDELNRLITTRTNVMNRKLREVTVLPQHAGDAEPEDDETSALPDEV